MTKVWLLYVEYGEFWGVYSNKKKAFRAALNYLNENFENEAIKNIMDLYVDTKDSFRFENFLVCEQVVVDAEDYE